MIKKIFFLTYFFLYSFPVLLNATELNDDLLDGVLAVVNGEIILASDLRYELKKEAIQLSSNPQYTRNSSQTVLLDKMINELILVQRAQNLQIDVTPDVVERVMLDIAKRGGLSLKQLQAEIEKQGLSYIRFRKGIEKELIFTRLRDVEVESQLRISENEIDFFLEFHANNNLSADEVLLSQFKVPFEKNISKKGKESLKLEVISKFSKLKSQLEDNRISSKKRLNDFVSMGWRSYDRLPKLFVGKIQVLKKGEFSEIIESPSGFHILFLEDRRSSIIEKEVPIFKARHILLKIDSPNNESTVRRRALELRDQVIDGDSFSDLAIRYSADKGSAVKGGELGWAYPGDYVAEFEKAVMQLKVGEISQPIRSIFGFHIIELIDRRLEPLTKERQRKMAKTILKENKLKETTDEWVRELRANSYVEIKIGKI